MKNRVQDISLTLPIGEGRIYDPYTISLHLTDLCNRACIFCAEDSHHRSQDSVKTEKLLEFLEKHRGDKWSAVNIHGGEPTTRKDFFTILEKIREMGYKKIILQTNAIKMADRAFAARVHAIGVDLFNAGFHGHTQELMDRITQTEKSFELALKGFHNIKEAGSLLRITPVICRLNYKYIKDICQVAVENGVDQVHISAMQPGGGAESCLDQLMIPYAQAYPYIKEAIDYLVGQNKMVTLEGFPYCVVPGCEKYQLNWKKQQLKVLYRDLIIDDFNDFLEVTMRTTPAVCSPCILKSYCSGVYSAYISFYGPGEFKPYKEGGK
jgi:MoaA/NifB/PqqE/SkfB family radical SAM enzyme